MSPPTPLPAIPLAVGCVLQFIECLALLLTNAIIPFMVEDFFPEMPASQVGFWSGSLLSILFVGQLISVPLWGWLADHWGRRPVLILGLLGIIVFVACFGLSPSYEWALVARFLWGLGCGNTGVMKAYLSEITDHSNVGTGIGLLGMQWSLGQTLGPLIGGALARPARKYAQYLPALDAPFFHDFPYALACALPVVLGLLAFVPTLLWLPETRCHDASTVVEDVDGLQSSFGMHIQGCTEWVCHPISGIVLLLPLPKNK
eukprot:EG_transcript_24763